MKKINSHILNASLSEIKNEKTGEITEMTKIVYTIERENTNKLIGPAMLECYKVGNYLETLSKYVMKPVQIDLEERPVKNGCKYVITKVNNQEL